MRHAPLGRSGLLVSTVGLGCNNVGGRLDLDGTRAVVDAALDVGITLLDTADVYGNRGGSEELLGQVLKGRRDEVVLATKFGMDMHGAYGDDHGARGSRRYVRRAVEGSLRRLQADHLDLYQYHRPDGVTPLEETLSVLHDLVREGKVRYIGHSNLAAWQVTDAHWLAEIDGYTPFVSAQNHYSLLDREVEAELIPACVHHGVGVLPYFPLANGLLTGKVRRGTGIPADSRLAARQDVVTEERLDIIEALARWAEQRDHTLLEVAIAGLAAQPAVGSVIAGAMTSEQVRANAAAGRWQPTPEELAEIDELAPPSRP